MPDQTPLNVTGFLGSRLVASGALAQVASALHRALEAEPDGPCLAFDDGTGRVLELDLRGTADEVRARFADGVEPAPAPARSRRSPGRPRLGVIGKEVTLLPRHWDWLGAQPGGASAALRRLIDQARKTGAGAEQRRRAQEAAYSFIRVMAGDRVGFEEATRALFAGDQIRFEGLVAEWPADVARQAVWLPQPSFAPPAD